MQAGALHATPDDEVGVGDHEALGAGNGRSLDRYEEKRRVLHDRYAT
jgi:hypothetical protein